VHYYLIIFSLTVYSSALWPALPAWPYLAAMWLIVLSVFALRNRAASKNRIANSLLVFAAGVLWATLWGHWQLSDSLPIGDDKSDYYVTGVVSGIPERRTRSTRFILAVDSVRPVHMSADSAVPTPSIKRLQLSWYDHREIVPGQRWRFAVRLRSPRGFTNPGGFDYRLWLLRKGISATGYVRHAGESQYLGQTGQYLLDRFRQRIAEAIYQSDISELRISATARHLLVALTVGSKQGLSGEVWQQLRITGTIHLLIVSGLHIGMAAALGMLIGSLLGRSLSALGVSCTHVQTGAVGALLFAVIYAAMAGFSLPTQRALVMLSVFLLAVICKRALHPWLAFCWALALQALLEPLAVYSAGFWLSYGAVAVFIWYFSCRGRMSWLKGLVAAQLLVLLMLSGVLIYFQGSVSLLAPLINLFVLPWFTVLIVPVALLGVLVFPVSQYFAEWLWWLAGYQLQWFDGLLEWLTPYSRYGLWRVVSDQHLLVAIAAIAAGALLLLPRGLGVRAIALVLLAALTLIVPPQAPLLSVTVLDVGQGLAVVVATADGILVYDTGPRFSDHFDAGSAIVAPYLRYRGVKNIDVLMISHSDADHSGGVAGLLSQFDAHRIIAGQVDKINNAKAEPCRAGMGWRWGDVEFEVIHPDADADADPDADSSYKDQLYEDNDYSCVIAIRLGGDTILLTGDISADVEAKLLKENRLPGHVTVLVAPHHGSKSSSTADFVNAIAPQHVVYSAGFHHHFGHPHPLVTQRYAAVKARQWSTGEAGAISFQWQDGNAMSVVRARDKIHGYWHDPF